MVLNSDLIEHIDATPDTVISLTTGQKVMVLENVERVVELVVEFRRSICSGFAGCNVTPRGPDPPGDTSSDRDD